MLTNFGCPGAAAVRQQTVNLFPLGKHCRFESYGTHQTMRHSAKGRRGLQNRSGAFRLRHDAPNAKYKMSQEIKKYLYITESFGDKIKAIQRFLIEWYDEPDWKSFVDDQEIGDCQSIVHAIKREFPEVTSVFGEIEVDEPYIDEYDNEQTMVTHHWIEINGEIYDFSKGTLRDYIEWDDVYSPESEDYSMYHPIRKE